MYLLLGVFIDITLIIITFKLNITRPTAPRFSRSHIQDKEWSTVRLLCESITISLSGKGFLKLRTREINNKIYKILIISI